MKKYKIYTEKELEMYHFFEVQKGNLRALREQIDTLRNVIRNQNLSQVI